MSYRHLASLAAIHNSALETEEGGGKIGDANPQGYWGIQAALPSTERPN